MWDEMWGWATEGQRHGIPLCCGLRFGFDCARPKLLPKFGKPGMWLFLKLRVLVSNPRALFALMDQQGYVPCEYHLLRWLLTGKRPEIMQDDPKPVPDIHALAAKALAVCEQRGWDRSWSPGGCYLHLEVSEFIEALRGKGTSNPTEEAGDVLFVLLSMLAPNGVDLGNVLRRIDEKCDQHLEDPFYREVKSKW